MTPSMTLEPPMTILDLSVLDTVTGGTAFSGSHGTLLPRPEIHAPGSLGKPNGPSPFNPKPPSSVPLGPFTPSDPHRYEV
jgi:hypothetical protein